MTSNPDSTGWIWPVRTAKAESAGFKTRSLRPVREANGERPFDPCAGRGWKVGRGNGKAVEMNGAQGGELEGGHETQRPASILLLQASPWVERRGAE